MSYRIGTRLPDEGNTDIGQRNSGSLAVRWFSEGARTPADISRPLEMALGRGQTTEVGAYANQRLTQAGKAHGRKGHSRTGPGKTGRTGACPGKAGVLSRRQDHRGKSQEPRSLDSKEGNRNFPKRYRQSHLILVRVQDETNYPGPCSNAA